MGNVDQHDLQTTFHSLTVIPLLLAMLASLGVKALDRPSRKKCWSSLKALLVENDEKEEVLTIECPVRGD